MEDGGLSFSFTENGKVNGDGFKGSANTGLKSSVAKDSLIESGSRG